MSRTLSVDADLCTGRYISDRVANNGEPQDTITWFDCSENAWCILHGCKEAGECPMPRTADRLERCTVNESKKIATK